MINKILLVDDSKTQLDVLKVQLIKNGYEVEAVCDALEAYHKVFSFVPDVIMSDIIMPELDGYQLCRLLKNNDVTKNIPIILLTVLDKNLDRFWGKKAGAQAFISKNVDFNIIKSKINEVIETSKLTENDKAKIAEYKIENEDSSVNNQINHILNELLMQSTFLNEFRNLNEYFTHEKVLVEKMFDMLSSFVEYDVASAFFNPPDDLSKKILYFDMKNSDVSAFVIENIKRNFFSEIQISRQFKTTEYVHEYINKSENISNNKILSINSIKSTLILPLVFEGKMLGGVAFYSKDNIDYSKFKFFNILKNELLTLFEMKSLYTEVEFLSVTDGLTGLYNRRYFEFNLEREFLRAKRYKNNLSMAILDIDFFKKINDTFGHQCGDYILKEVARLTKESFRKTDMIYRYGGEEFTIILPETSLTNASIPLERLRNKIEAFEFVYNNEKIKLSISVGISEMKYNYSEQTELLSTADKALYKAKQTGRNKVVIYNG